MGRHHTGRSQLVADPRGAAICCASKIRRAEPTSPPSFMTGNRCPNATTCPTPQRPANRPTHPRVRLVFRHGRVLGSITADSCGWHDPLGGHGPINLPDHAEVRPFGERDRMRSRSRMRQKVPSAWPRPRSGARTGNVVALNSGRRGRNRQLRRALLSR